MSQDRNSVENEDWLAVELRQMREVIGREMARLQEQLAEAQGELKAVSAEKAALRVERDQLRGAQGGAEERIARLQKEVAALMQGAMEREREYSRRDEAWLDELLQAQKDANAVRMEMGRMAEKVVAAEAALRNAQSQVARLEAAQRAQMDNIGALEPRLKELANARSRKLLLKMGLVKKCRWEK